MTFNPLEYKGNAIFRNQPNHTYFDKSLEDGTDPLFLLLNDIDPYFWQPEQRANSLSVSSVSVIDPRTQKSITQLEYDHTKEVKCKIFESPKASLLTAKQHKMCVEALNCLQNGQSVEEEHFHNLHSARYSRLKEKERFKKFVDKFCLTNSEDIYGPCRKLLDLYQKWYKLRSRQLMKRYPQESYNTHLGLPHVTLCKNALKEIKVDICRPEILSNLGAHSKWNHHSGTHFVKLEHRLESYLQIYINSEDKQDELEKEMHNLFVKKIDEGNPNEYPLFYIPLESLLFLLTAGDDIDLPMEMLLNIIEIADEDNENQKVIIMDLPLPARQAGWHCYQQVVEQSVLAVLSVIQMNQNANLSADIELQESSETTNNYKVFTLEEYMQNCKVSPDQLCQFSKTLIKWQLQPLDDEDTPFNIYTSISNAPVKEGEPDNLFSLKLEYKPHLGCEIKTKYQLLKEWLHLKLLQGTKTTCFRLDVTNYRTLLQESLTLQKIEEYLSTIYHINCEKLLANLFEFLKILHSMPPDNYMLRFNFKFKDKLMLCKPSNEFTPNTIHLHQLLNADVTDILFMSQQSFLSIDDNLCSLMHLQYNILPCAFSPKAVPQKTNKKFYEKKKQITASKTRDKLKKKEHKKRKRQRK